MSEPRMVPLIYCFGRRVGFPGMDASRFTVERFPFRGEARASDREQLAGEWRFELWMGPTELARGTAPSAHNAAAALDYAAKEFLRELRSWFRELDAEDNREAERERGLEIPLGPFVHRW